MPLFKSFELDHGMRTVGMGTEIEMGMEMKIGIGTEMEMDLGAEWQL